MARVSFGTRFSLLHMQTVAITARKDLEKHEKVFRSLISYLKKAGMTVYLEERVAEYINAKKFNLFLPGETKVDMIIVMGGDGTILRVVNQMHHFNTKFFGVNLGNLGFLSEIPPVGINKTLGRIFAGEYTLDKRVMLEVKLERNGKIVEKFCALNEVVISQGTLSRLIHLNTKVDGRKLTKYKSDGLIVATPTGSTAYSLSAGGPIVHPAVSAIILTPICPNTFTQKPIVIPDSKKVQITVDSEYEQINLTSDGQRNIGIEYKDIIHIKKHGFIHFVRLPNENYFRTLRGKLGWGEDVEKR